MFKANTILCKEITDRQNYHRGQNYYNKTRYKHSFGGNSFCSYYKALCIGLQEDQKIITKSILQGIIL